MTTVDTRNPTSLQTDRQDTSLSGAQFAVDPSPSRKTVFSFSVCVCLRRALADADADADAPVSQVSEQERKPRVDSHVAGEESHEQVVAISTQRQNASREARISFVCL